MTFEIIYILLAVITIVLVVSGLLYWSYQRKQSKLPENTTKLSQTRIQVVAEAIGFRSAIALYDSDLHPSQAEWGLRRSALAQAGVNQDDILLILGSHNVFYTRTESADQMAAYCRQLKKKI